MVALQKASVKQEHHLVYTASEPSHREERRGPTGHTTRRRRAGMAIRLGCHKWTFASCTVAERGAYPALGLDYLDLGNGPTWTLWCGRPSGRGGGAAESRPRGDRHHLCGLLSAG